MTRSPGEMVVEDVSGPGRARAGHVIVRPEAVGICGSDFHLFSGDLGALSGRRDYYPRVQGHEVSAIIEDPGDSAGQDSAGQDSAVTQGDRVAIWPLIPCGHCYPCRQDRPNVCVSFRLLGMHLDGGLQERLEIPAGLVFKAGDLDPDSTCFVEPASVAVHALKRARLQPGEQVVVFGAGPIGLATLVAAVHQGARVLSVDPVASRRDLAKRLGAEAVTWIPQAGQLTELTRDWTDGEGPPLVVETSGEAGVLPQAMDTVSQAGRVVVVGMSSGTAPVRTGAFPEKEIDVIGSSCATAKDFRDAISLVAANRAANGTAMAALFSHHFPLARAAEAIEFAMSRPPDAVKIVVTVN
ncbi:MAG: alcohol dehydrogenase catalytic domain-containing protein [Streptosporangiaceae bacterium]|nr:alcohol dehydrogenase catalytic domain-containing protein [Streptosporangiaceae bacterium]